MFACLCACVLGCSLFCNPSCFHFRHCFPHHIDASQYLPDSVNDEVIRVVKGFKNLKARLWQMVARSGMTHLSLSLSLSCIPSWQPSIKKHHLWSCVYWYFVCVVVRGIIHACSTTPSICSESFWQPPLNRSLLFFHQKVATHFRNTKTAAKLTSIPTL